MVEKRKRVLVVGGYGLIGTHVVTRLSNAGIDVIGAGRDIVAASKRFPAVDWVRADLAKMSIDDWAPLLSKMDAVVNCAGALQDSPADDLQAVHVTGLVALAEASRKAGVDQLIHISAAGVDEAAIGEFGRTKQDAERALMQIDMDWTILRPGLVLAPSAFGGSALLRGLAGFPFVIPAVYASSKVQVVSVNDVAEAVLISLGPASPRRLAVDLVARRATRLADILTALRAWLGLPSARVLSLPPSVARLSARASDALAWFGWRSPMRTAALAQLRHGVRGDPDAAQNHLGLKLQELDALLAAQPSGVQERWFAKLYFLKPFMLVGLAAFWAASGVVGFLQEDRAAEVLTHSGMPQSTALLAVRLGSATDVVLGLLILPRRTTAWALRGMVLVTAAYLVGATVWRPDLWNDPMGPLVKVVPAAILALVALAVLDER